MKKPILIYITIISIFSFNIYSQKAKLKTADKKSNSFAEVDAVKTYEKVVNKGYKSADMYKKLGNAYYFNAELDKAAKWYGELFTMTPNDLEPEYYYRYAQSLRSIGQNDKANEMLVQFNQLSEIKTR